MHTALVDFGQRYGLPTWLIDSTFVGGVALVLLLFLALTVMILVYLERKISADLQWRYGPLHVGWHGAMQLLADMVKLLSKEDVVPAKADRWVFLLAPAVAFVPAFLGYLVIPFGPNFIARDLNVGLLYFLAVPSISVVGIVMAGWGSSGKYSLIGGMRSAAQIISYEVPRTLSVLGVIMLAGTLSTVAIVDSQTKLWFVLLQPLGFLIYFVASVAEVNRVPFDLPEAESELVGGFHTEYSGMRFAVFFLAEYTNMFIVSAVATVLFLGGWQGPFLPGVVWFLIKVYALIFLIMWFRWTFPRVRFDQLITFAWKILIPLAFVNLLLTALALKL